MKHRDYAFDNIKFILITLVVFGHFLEISKGYGTNCDWYRVIYSFHMPVMFFISGYFAKFNKRKIINCLVLYVVFQLIYITFSNTVLNYNLEYQFGVPHWLLWYLLVYIFYLCLVPILDVNNKTVINKYEHILVMFVMSFGLCFVAPYLFESGSFLAVLRFFFFLPYFLAGFYLKRLVGGDLNKLFKSKKIEICSRILFLLLAISSVVIIMLNDTITAPILYGSSPYGAFYDPYVRLILLFCAFSWISFFVVTLRVNKKIPVITKVGGNTMVVFLLHGFVSRLLQHFSFLGEREVGVVFILLLSILAVVILGSIRVRFKMIKRKEE